MIEERDLEFAQTLWARPARFTKIILGINIFIFVLMTVAGGTTNEATLLAFGVKANDLIDQGEIWRLVTPIFIHIGVLHLFFNSYALWMVGAQVERLYGGPRFLLLYLLTGIAGVVASYWRHPFTLSAGASGAIFGLFGVLLVFGFKYKKSIPAFFQRAVGAGVLPVIIINLIIGFTIPAIDNAAHIGGLVAGALLALIVPFDRPGSVRHVILPVMQASVIFLVAASFYPVVTNYQGPEISLRNLGSWSQMIGSQPAEATFIQTMGNTQQVFTRSVEELSSGDSENLDELGSETAAAIDQLSDIPSIAPEPDRISAELLEVMQSQYSVIEDVQRAGTMTFGTSNRARQNSSRFEELMTDLNRWVQRSGEEYGIRLRRP